MRITLPRRPPGERTPQVEVVVPCHNYGHFLPECVDSVLSQPGVSTRVTIVDDASTDGSASVARRLADVHPEVKLIEHAQNQGAVATFNDGLSQADADYVLLLSADDVLAPGALARATSLMEVHPSVGLVYGHARAFSGSTPPWRPGWVTWTTWTGQEWLGKQFRRGWNSISSPEAVVRAAVQHEVGYYNADLPHTHDVEMWLRIAAVADVGHVNGVDQAFYRVHGNNLSSTFTQGLVSDLDERSRAYSSFLDRAPAGFDVERFRLMLARRASNELMELALWGAAQGQQTQESIDEAIALALELDPSVRNRREWRDLEAVRSGSSRRSALGVQAHQRRRDISNRARWWRWRLVGV